MRRLSLIFTFLFFSSIMAFSQYDFAIGLRSGGTSGITLKKNNPSTSVEGIVGIWNDGLSFTGLFEQHPGIAEVPGLHWVYGVGAHVAFYSDNFRGAGGPAWFDYNRDIADDDLGLGVDAIIGIEYKIPPLPLAFSIDIKPFVEFTTDGVVWFAFDPGLGIKFAF
ncbi:MAG: hypothetical protein ACOC31_04005 [Bacteroidota bacterium]